MVKKSAYDNTSKKLQKISKIIGAITAIIGAATGICTWVSNQFQSVVSSQISELGAEIRASDKEQTLVLTRLELLSLMENDPENTVAIVKLARHYFRDLNGNSWMSERYSKFAEEHGLDASFVIGDK